MNEFGRDQRQAKQDEREIRRLRLQMDKISSGGRVRPTAVVGPIPASARPVEWYFNANLLGLGDELELLEGPGVWISGSFVGGRAYYHIGAYGGGDAGISGVDFLLDSTWFCFGQALDLVAAAGVWISGSCADGVARYEIGAEAGVAYYGEISIDDNAVGQTLVNADQWYKITQFDTNGSSSGMTNDQADNKITVENAGTYELTFVASFNGSASVVYHLAIYIDGVIDTSLKIQRDIGTANTVGAVAIAGLAAIGAGDDIEVYVSCDGNNKEYLQGHANLSIRTIGRGAGGGAEGITGIDFAANDLGFGFGRALDLQEAAGVWISGSMDGDEAEYQIGAYPPDLSPYLTGVDLSPFLSGIDFLADDVWFGFGRALDLLAGLGIWISGTMVDDEANYQIGLYTTGAAGGAPADAEYWVRTGSAELSDEIVLGDGAEAANTTPSNINSQWGNKGGNARMVVVWDDVLGRPVWAHINAVDILTPAQILTFYGKPNGAYPDGSVGKALVGDGTNKITPAFILSYEPNTPTALSIDITASSGGYTPEVNPGDYPDTTWADYARAYETSEQIWEGDAVGEWVTFTATATVGGVAGLTKEETITFWNERMWGESTNAAIDTEAEIDTFHGAQNKEVSNSLSKSFTVTLGAGEYMIWISRTALGDPTFIDDDTGFGIDMTKVGDAISWDNARGFREDFDVWRSTYPNLGVLNVVVS